MRINTSAFLNNKSGSLSPFQLNKQNPLNKTLQTLITQASGGMNQSKMIADKLERDKLTKASLDTYTKTESKNGDVSTMSTEDLKNLAALMKTAGANASFYQSELQTYKGNLKNFDTAINKYEGMVAGTEQIPEGLTLESVNEFLDMAKEARSTYENGVNNHLQNQSQYYQGQIKNSVRLASAISGEDYSDVKDMDLEFHPGDSGTYDEIERVSGELDNIVGQINKSLSSVYGELEKRGESSGYQLYFEHKGRIEKPMYAGVEMFDTSFLNSLVNEDNEQ